MQEIIFKESSLDQTYSFVGRKRTYAPAHGRAVCAPSRVARTWTRLQIVVSPRLGILNTACHNQTDGFAFSSSPLPSVRYLCELTQNSSTGMLMYATHASAISVGTAHRQLVCNLSPPGFGRFVAGTLVQLQLLQMQMQENSTAPVPVYPFRVPLDRVGIWSRDLDIMEILVSLQPRSVTAMGRTLLYLSGHGFASRVGSAPCSYSATFGRCT